MEVDGHVPHGGERTPGALEDGDDASRAPQDPADGSEGPQDPGAAEGPGPSGPRSRQTRRRSGPGDDEGPGDPGPRSHETPRHAVLDEGPRDEGPRGDCRTTEGPGASGTGSHEGPRRTGHTTEGPRDSGTGSHEGPHRSCHPTEGPGASGTGSHEGPRRNCHPTEGPRDSGTGNHEGPRRNCHPTEGTGASGTGSHEGPRRTGHTTEGPGASGTRSHEEPRDEGPHRNCHPTEGPGASGSGSHETLRHTGADQGPRRSRRTTEGPGASGSGSHETPRHAGAFEGPGSSKSRSRSGADEGPRRTEGPDAREEHEVPGADEGPPAPRDLTAEQRDAGGADEGPHVPGPPQQRLPQQRHPFKKPVAPGRPGGGHEKGVEAGGQPAAAQPPVLPDGQAAPHVGLPPDAQRAPPALPYGEPAWSGRPRALYSLEVLKGGAILSSRDLSHVSCTVFGRLPSCHVPLEHPSVSRYHAVLQYRSVPGDGPGQESGFYVYDLGSTHGTFVNKHRIPSKEYCRVRVGHVVKFGGSTRLFILQGPEEDQEAESELTVTQIKEERRQRETLQKRMLGDDSDEEDEPAEEEKSKQAASGEEAGCMWGMGEDAMEEESEENPIALEFQEEREALYLKNPKKALQGFFDREGEELEFEYEERCPGSWICRVKLPADDCSGKQLVAEISHSGKKKEAANLCSLEACRMLEMRGLLRQEAVSRKRKAKKWEDEDFYDSDDDTFLDRTGVVEKKRLNRMKKAGKIDEKPETLESLTSKLDVVEKEILEVAEKLRTCQTGVSQSLAQDSLDAFMTEMRAGISMDSVSRKKLHLQSVELRKEQQRLKSLIRIVQPTRLPELCANPATDDPKTRKLTFPLYGAMKGGSKFKLKTGTVGRLPPKRTDLPASLFIMKSGDEPEEEDEDEDHEEDMKVDPGDGISEDRPAVPETSDSDMKSDPATGSQTSSRAEDGVSREIQEVVERRARRPLIGQEKSGISKPAAETPRRMYGPSKPPEAPPTAHYPEDDPDYCVWTPPAGQSGDGKTHLNEKYGY